IKNDQFLAVEGRLLIHRGFTGHACRPHEKSGLESANNPFMGWAPIRNTRCAGNPTDMTHPPYPALTFQSVVHADTCC
ncbi:hypothetical protein, partial [Pseudomonas sp.]|uniref:hypothetical protein n=1 Tax=Pseudomonas sp. TaxID=306 RepID=UPI00290EB8F8